MTARVLILAAGQASRMGRVKALLPLPLGADGEFCSALEGLARLFRQLGIEHISVVTGWHAESIEPAAQALGLAVVRNPRPEEGMFSSVCAGLSALAAGDPALAETPILVQPVDVPLVRPMTIQALLEAHASDPESVLVPTFAGQEGHPPLLPARHLAHVLHHERVGAENGLRGALESLPVRHIPVADGCMLPDMDRPEDYERMKLLALRRDVLRPDEALELLRLHEVPERGVRHGRAVGTVAAALAKALAEVRRTKNSVLEGVTVPNPGRDPGRDSGRDSGRDPGRDSGRGFDCGACRNSGRDSGPDSGPDSDFAPGFDLGLDPDLALAGGLVHDICKGEKGHEAAAGRLFRHLHLPVMAHLVEDHRDLTLPDDQPITERELVFLADKYCYGGSFVPVRQRFEQKLESLGAEVAQAIRGRMDRALAMEARLARELGCPTGEQGVRDHDQGSAQGQFSQAGQAPQPPQAGQSSQALQSHQAGQAGQSPLLARTSCSLHPPYSPYPTYPPYPPYPEDIARAALAALAVQETQAQGDRAPFAPLPQ
ncbi:NTP transferase domain-containing protein [Desulfovibrio sp.]|uniref:NTP transferase domain-containing protein n=1 Tax=Desulfovibrio sp. TaxID=885 RepID=UPI003D0E848F